MRTKVYLDCGCSINDAGARFWCPTCAAGGYRTGHDNARLSDVILAVELLASHVKNLYRKAGIDDPEVPMEIDMIIKRMRRG